MSKILALDTSSDACSVALWNEGEIIEDFQMLPRQHAQALLPQLQALLAEAGLRLGQLDAIAFGRGPGSFTGLRIAAATAQGLALAQDLPLLPLSTLQALALSAQKNYFARRVLTVLDARMDEVYWCAWQAGQGAPEPLIEEKLDKPEAILLPTDQETDWLLVGSGGCYRERFPAQMLSQIQQEIPDLYPRAAALAELGALAFLAGQAVDAADAQPIYLRDQVTG